MVLHSGEFSGLAEGINHFTFICQCSEEVGLLELLLQYVKLSVEAKWPSERNVSCGVFLGLSALWP